MPYHVRAKNYSMFKYLKNDLPSSIVVFFVALPLCLGIALASGAPLFSGLIAGIVAFRIRAGPTRRIVRLENRVLRGIRRRRETLRPTAVGILRFEQAV